MSALRGALERIGDARPLPAAAAAHLQSVPGPQSVFADPARPRLSTPLVAQVCEPPPAPIVESPVGTLAEPPAIDETLSESASRLSNLFPAPALVVFVGCGISVDGPSFTRRMAGALGHAASRSVEIVEPSRWDDAEQFAAARNSVFRRGALALAFLAAEKATSRSAELGQTSGVVLLVEAGRCDVRAADVVATALRLQGVAVRGVVLVD